jgi:hypothetical protein
MPRYLGPNGLSCTSDEALSLGKLRPGYRELLSDGETVGFNAVLMDSGSPARMFFTDSNASDRSLAQQASDAVRDGRYRDAAAVNERAFLASAAALNDWRGEATIKPDEATRDTGSSTRLTSPVPAAKLQDLAAAEKRAYQASNASLNAWRSTPTDQNRGPARHAAWL